MSTASSPPAWRTQILEVFQQSEDPVVTAVEVADYLDVSQQAAHSKLTKAYNEGIIDRKKVGSRAVAWWLEDQSDSSA